MDLDEADGVTSRVTVFAAMQKQQRAILLRQGYG